MPKRKCVFNESLQNEFKFITKCQKIGQEDKVECTVCGGIFSIDHGGKSDINQHIKTNRHKLTSNAKKSQKVSDFFNTKSFNENQNNLSADEGVFAYHICKHNHSIRSMDCTSQLVRKLFNKKFSCGKTKTAQIIKNVFYPYANEMLKIELSKCNFISVLTDASNHQSQKMVPVMIRYFIPNEGVKTKILEFDELSGETSLLLTDYISKVLSHWGVLKKVIAFSADNTNSNFGGVNRRGKNNVFYKLKESINTNLIGIGCAAHILNNSIQTAADTLPIDIQAVLGKIFQHFYIYTVRVHALKEFCDFVNVEYKSVLGHSKTRWLSLYPALTRLIEMFEGLKSYFLSIEKCPAMLKIFFENPLSLLLTIFLQTQCELFFNTIKSVETANLSIVEVKSHIDTLLLKIKSRNINNFMTIKEAELLNNLRDESILTQNIYNNFRTIFFDTCSDYITEWTNPTLCKFNGVSWITLKNIEDDFSWKNISNTIQLIKNVIPSLTLNEAELFDEFTIIKTNLQKNQNVKSFNTLDEKWTYVFKIADIDGDFPNLKIVVEFLMCIPGSNANVERIFSDMNNLWTDDKSRFDVKTVKAMLVVKHFFTENCSEFHDFLLGNKNLLKNIHSSEKYFPKE
uniref:HAT C-terminal dimerisation domain-containing protein n=1 Tax=Schizaphis graminum TaxID=13262 RepID=A0A2S2N9H4_SCHGA